MFLAQTTVRLLGTALVSTTRAPPLAAAALAAAAALHAATAITLASTAVARAKCRACLLAALCRCCGLWRRMDMYVTMRLFIKWIG